MNSCLLSLTPKRKLTLSLRVTGARPCSLWLGANQLSCSPTSTRTRKSFRIWSTTSTHALSARSWSECSMYLIMSLKTTFRPTIMRLGLLLLKKLLRDLGHSSPAKTTRTLCLFLESLLRSNLCTRQWQVPSALLFWKRLSTSQVQDVETRRNRSDPSSSCWPWSCRGINQMSHSKSALFLRIWMMKKVSMTKKTPLFSKMIMKVNFSCLFRAFYQY